MTQRATTIDGNEKRLEWEQALRDLASQVQEWCARKAWPCEVIQTPITERNLGTYTASTLHIHTGSGALIIEPVGRNLVSGEGRVDIYSVRTFARLLLIRDQGKWVLYADNRVPWPEAWNESSFVKLAESLTAR